MKLGTPLSPRQLNSPLLAAGELGKKVIIALPSFRVQVRV